MKKKIGCFLFLICCCGFSIALQGQETIPATGGNTTGSGGSVSYTIGQVTYQTLSGTTGAVAQGVQQPYEISILKENSENTSFEITVYPNPTTGLITLVIRPFSNENLRFQLINFKGIILMDKKIESEETEISMEKYSPSIYLLKVLNDGQIVKVVKIAKIKIL
jgi:hypothetical protein